MTSSLRSSTAPEGDADARASGEPTLTLAVMARPPIAGRCKTRLGAHIGLDVAARVYEAMLLDTIASLSRISARHVVLAAPEDDGVAALTRLAPPGWEVIAQRGSGLGERLTNGIVDLHRAGELVCLLDSDSPTLPFDVLERRLEEASRAPRRVVAGPCEDGGYYLIGLTSVDLGVFEGVPWSTGRVMDVTRERCLELGLVLEELPSSFDVDDGADLLRLGGELSRRPEVAPRTAELLRELDLSVSAGSPARGSRP